MQKYFDGLGIVKSSQGIRVFGDLDDAIEWIEERFIERGIARRR